MMNPFAKKTTNEDIAIRGNKKGFKTFSTGELMAEKMSICPYRVNFRYITLFVQSR